MSRSWLSKSNVDGKEAAEIKQGLKTQDEIDRFTVDDSVGEIPRALAFLAHGMHPSIRPPTPPPPPPLFVFCFSPSPAVAVTIS